MKPATIHQIWFGAPILTEEDENNSKEIAKQAEKQGIAYKRWNADMLLETFNNDPLVFLMKKLIWNCSSTCTHALAANYYKWKILSTIPKGEIGIYMDIDVKLKDNTAIEIPNYGNLRNVLLAPGGATSFVLSNGSLAPDIACKLAGEELMENFHVDEVTFVPDTLRKFINLSEDKPYKLGKAFMDKVIQEWNKVEIKCSTISTAFFAPDTLKTKNKPVFTHFARRYYAECVDDMTYQHKLNEEIKVSAQEAKKAKPYIVVLMSSAAEYEHNSARTLNIITAEQIRYIQRVTSFKPTEGKYEVLKYFVVGASSTISTSETDVLHTTYKDGKEFRAKNTWWAMRWVMDNLTPSFIFLCDDDTYINMDRLVSYCEKQNPSSADVKIPNQKEGSLVGGGILIPAEIARKLVSSDYHPEKGDDISKVIKEEVDKLKGQCVGEFKFSNSKAQFPATTNRLITCHGCNLFDLVELASQF